MPQPEKLYLRAKEIVALGIVPSKATLYRWLNAGDFPRPIKLATNGTTVFRKVDIDRWIAAREAA